MFFFTNLKLKELNFILNGSIERGGKISWMALSSSAMAQNLKTNIYEKGINVR